MTYACVCIIIAPQQLQVNATRSNNKNEYYYKANAYVKEGSMNEQDNKPLVLTVRQTAALLELSIRSTYELCKRPDFPSLKLTPNRIGVSRVALENWIEDQIKNEKEGK